MNPFCGVKTHAVWVIMLHPDPGHHFQEHGSTPMTAMHLFKIKLSMHLFKIKFSNNIELDPLSQINTT